MIWGTIWDTYKLRRVTKKMNYDEEREKLIEEAQEFTSFPPPDYSKMTNEQIKLRTKIMKNTFERLFDKNDQDNENEDDYLQGR